MTTPTVGTTHDLVFYVNHSVTVGAVVSPFTYRVNYAPSFVPRYASGDPRGVDRARWKSFIQSRFDGGAGQFYWGKSNGNNRYAESHMVDIGVPWVFPKEELGIAGDIPVNVGVQRDPDDSVIGDISPAILPSATTVGSLKTATLFTQDYPLHMLEYSNRPLVWQFRGAFLYTNVDDPQAWNPGTQHRHTDKLTGEWAVLGTYGAGIHVHRAVRYSGIAVVALGDNGIANYGPQDATVNPGPSVSYSPSYSTVTHDLTVYDKKLWRAHIGKVSYLNPAVNTLDAQWSDYLYPGDPGVPVVQMKEFNGRLYFGKEDSLWIFDAGRVYKVEDFEHERSTYNFKMMVVFRGYMYFNIRGELYRVSTGGLLEKIETPFYGGVIMDGAAIGRNLFVLVRKHIYAGETAVWIFDPETGGSRRWFRSRHFNWPLVGRVPSGLKAAFGHIWISPFLYTGVYSTSDYASPISAADWVTPAVQNLRPNFGKSHSWLITSMFDQGYPNLEKLYNKVVVDYTLASPDDIIEVRYLTKLEGRRQPDAAMLMNNEIGGLGNDDVSDTVVDGDFTTTESFTWGLDAGHYQDVAIGFLEKPPTGLVMYFVEESGDSSDIGPFYTAYGSEPIKSMADPTLPASTYPHFFETEGGRDVFRFNWGELDDWKKMTKKDLVDTSGAGSSSGLDDTIEYYWVVINNPDVTSRELQEVVGTISTTYRLEEQPWTLLGQIAGSDYEDTKKSLSFPSGLSSEQIMLKFDFWATKHSRPDIRRFEIEYLPFPSELLNINASIIAHDPIELLNGEVEHSAGLIKSAMYSMAGSGLTHVVGIPEPSPVGRTIRALIHVTPPGISTPVMSYQTQEGVDKELSVEIPVKIEEI